MTETKSRLNGAVQAIPPEEITLAPLKPKIELYTGTVRLKIEDCPLPTLSKIVTEVLATASKPEKQ